MTQRPDSPEIEILKEVQRPPQLLSGPISRLTASDAHAVRQYENGRQPTISPPMKSPNLATLRELYRQQRQDARERGFTTGSSEDRRYAQVITKARQSVASANGVANWQIPAQSFGLGTSGTTLSSSGKPQAIVQPIRNTVRESGNLVPLFNILVPRVGPSKVSDINDHDYQGIPRNGISVMPAGQPFSAGRTMPISNSSFRSNPPPLLHSDPRMRAGVTVSRFGAPAPASSISVSERNVRPIDLRDLLSPSNEVVQQPRSVKIVTQFSSSSSIGRSVKSVVNSGRKQSITQGDQKDRANLTPERFYWRSLAFNGPEDEEEEYKGRFQCEWDGCDAVLPSNVSFVNHLLAHFLDSPVKFKPGSDVTDDVSLADFCRCHHCFSVFNSPFELQSHLLVAHASISARLNKRCEGAGSATTCFVCEKAFASFAALLEHMTTVHEHPDAPYWCRKCRFRSSLHRDVMYHFMKEHHGTLTLMCPLCLWMMDARLPFANNRTTVINVGDFIKHIQMHDERQGEGLSCGRCLLTFAREADMVRHKVQHSKFVSKPGSSDLIQIPCVGGLPKPLASAERREFPCRRLRRAAVRTLTLSEGVCVECRQRMDSDAHYRPSPVSCMVCSFVTTCNNSYENHVSDHTRGSEAAPSNVFHRTEPLLSTPGMCACGFSSVRGNVLACHVALCLDSFDTVSLRSQVKAISKTDACPPAPLLILKQLRLKPTSPQLLDQWAKPLVNVRDEAYVVKVKELLLRAAESKSRSSSHSPSLASGSVSPPPQLIRSLISPKKKRTLADVTEEGNSPKDESEPPAKVAIVREEQVFIAKNSSANETGTSYSEIRCKADSAATAAISLRSNSRALSILSETWSNDDAEQFLTVMERAVIADVVADLVTLVSNGADDIVGSRRAANDTSTAEEVNFDDFLNQLEPDRSTGNLFDRLLTDKM